MFKRKCLAIVLTLAMVFTMLPAMAMAEEEVEVSNLQELKEALEENNHIVLTDNIELTEQLNIPAGVTIDGDGHSISIANDVVWASSNSGKYLFVVNGNNVTIQNITLDAETNAAGCLQFYNVSGGKIENITLKNAKEFYLPLNINASEVTASGNVTVEGTNSAEKDYIINVSWGSSVAEPGTVDGSIFDASAATLSGIGFLYADANDLANAESAGKSISIIPAAGYIEIGDPENVDVANGMVYSDKAAVVMVDDLGYTKIESALAKADAEAEIILIDDIKVTETVTIEKNITIDTNGHTFDLSNTRLNIAADVVLTDSQAEGGKILSSDIAVQIKETAKATVDGNITIESSKSGGILLSANSELVVNNGKIIGYYYAIVGNGTYDNTKITINDGYIEGKEASDYPDDAVAIYHPQFGDLTINGGTLIGESGIQYCGAGNVNITGGTIKANAEYTEFPEKTAAEGDGTAIDGAALSLISRGGGYQDEGQSINVTISGGEFISANNSAVSVYRLQKTGSNWITNENTTLESYLAQLNITGGEFKSGAQKANLEIDSKAAEAVAIKGGYFTTKPENAFVADGYAVSASDKEGYAYLVAEKSETSAEVTEPVIPAPIVPEDMTEEEEAVLDGVKDAIEQSKPVSDDSLTEAATVVADNNSITADEGKEALENAQITVNEHDEVVIVIQPTMEIEITSVDAENKTYTVNITPQYQVIATTDKDGIDIGTNAVVMETKPLEITSAVEVNIPVPNGFALDADNLYVKHTKDGKFVAYHKATVSGDQKTITFTNDKGFSEFTPFSDDRSAVVNFDSEVAQQTYKIDSVGTSLPTASKDGKKFNGWKFENISGTYKVLTEDLWNQIAGKTVNATASFSNGSSNSGQVPQKTLTFETNGGSKIDSITANYGKTIVLADYTPKKSGYNFAGWYKDSALKEKIEYAVLDYDMTVYAKWSANSDFSEDEGTIETKIFLLINDKTAVINGKNVTNDVPPLIVNSRTYTPARFVAESLGAKVDWNEADRTVAITKGETKIVLVADSTTAYVNGKAVQIDAAAFIADGRIFTPSRFVAENLGANVEWDEDARTVTIIKYAE